ncbi:MAG: MFS transporter [bacterium]
MNVSPKAGRREWIGLGVIALPCLLYSMDLTVLNLAIPRMSQDLKPTSAQLLWIVDIYGFVLAGLLITMGTLGDRIGRRRLLMMGAAAFGAASVLAAFSTSAPMLIAARAILGIAGATLAPSTLSLIRNMFVDARQRSVAISVWVTSYSVGGAIGPLVGGALLSHFWWGSVFLIGVPVMVLLLIVGPTLLPEFRDPNAGRIDLLSVAMSLAAVLLVIYGVKEFAQGVSSLIPVLSIVAGLVTGALFVHRQRMLAEPLIDLRLFSVRTFNVALGAYTLGTFIAFGIFLFESQYLQLVRGLSPLSAGLVMMPVFLSFIVGSMLSPVIARRVRPALVMAGGLVLASVGFLLLASMSVTTTLGVMMVGFVFYSLGLAPVFTLTTDLIVGAAPPEHAGVAAALSETGSELGGALGIAILGSIGTAVYRSAMVHAVPGGIPFDAAEIARRTLGGAVSVAERLPNAVGAELDGAARVAFTRAFDVSSAVCAATALLTALVVVLVLRNGDRKAGH